MGSLLLDIRALFNSAQDGIVLSKCVEQMKKLKDAANSEDFWQCFLNHLQKAMIYYHCEPAVEKVIEFVAKFSTFSLLSKRKENKENEAPELSVSNPSNEDEDPMDEFLLSLMNYLLGVHNARDKAVRYRACQLINKLFNHMGEDASIDEDLADRIYECMMFRIKDKFPQIRMQAVLALQRLQDPSDEECPVINAFLHSMQTDSSADVRKTVLTSIALSKKTLPYVIERTRDVKEANRKAAYLTLAEKVSIRALTIAQRIKLLSDGLKDRSDMVKEAAVKLLRAWYKSYDCKLVKLLGSLDAENSPECSELVIKVLLKGESRAKLLEHAAELTQQVDKENGKAVAADGKLLSYERLTSESVYFWFLLCQHIKQEGEELEDVMEQILPEMSTFCDYIQGYAERHFIDSAILNAFEGNDQQPDFVLQQLLKLLGLLDYSDEIGRQRVKQLVHDMLITETVPATVAPLLVARFLDAEPNEERFTQGLVEIIADIKEPMVQVVTTAMKEQARRVELQIARLRVRLNECKFDLEEAIKRQDYEAAAMLKKQVAEMEEEKDALSKEGELKTSEPRRIERDDPDTLLKCLTVASAMLDKIKKRVVSPTLTTLKEELVFLGVQNEDPFIRNEAVKCLGLLALLSREFACQHLVLFLQVAQVDQELLQITAVQIIIDLFLVYGLEAFSADKKESITAGSDASCAVMDADEKTIVEETPEESKEDDSVDPAPPTAASPDYSAAESILGILIMFLDGESSELRTVVAEGLAKLMISRRVLSAKILTKLILIWFNPVTEDDTKLRHCLGVFFSVFAFESRANQELFEESFLPILKTLLNAPRTSPLSQVNVANVADLLVQLTDVRNLARYNPKVLNSTAAKSATLSTQASVSLPDTFVHDQLALKIAIEILNDPDEVDAKLLLRILNMLHISGKNALAIRDLLEVTKQMLQVLEKNKVVLKLVQKFQSRLLLLSETANGSHDESVSAPSLNSTLKGNLNETEDDDKPLILLKRDRAKIKKAKGTDVELDTDGAETDEAELKPDDTLGADETLVSTDISAIALQKQSSCPRGTRGSVLGKARSKSCVSDSFSRRGVSSVKKPKVDGSTSLDVDLNVSIASDNTPRCAKPARATRLARRTKEVAVERTRKNLESFLLNDDGDDDIDDFDDSENDEDSDSDDFQ